MVKMIFSLGLLDDFEWHIVYLSFYEVVSKASESF